MAGLMARHLMANSAGLYPKMGNGGTRTKRRKKTAVRARAARRVRASSKSKPARLVKGSAAAKRYMAKIRKKRR